MASEDLISKVVHAEVDGEMLSDADIAGFCMLLLIAGNETTTNLLSNLLNYLAEDQRLWARLRKQPDKIDDAINAFLQAIRLQPDNPEFLQNIVQLLVQRGRWADALPYARNMVRLLPGNQQAKAFLAQIERNAQGQ